MDSGDAIQLIVLLLLILLSAFFSSAETAMTTVNKIRIMSLADDGNKKAKTLLKIIENPGKLLSTILIGNNIVNLSADGIQAKVVNIHTIKPLDEELVVAAAKECGKVVTVEEHSVIGGLGSAVCDVLCEKAPTPVLKIGVQDVFGESGPAVKLLEKYKLDGQGVYEQVKAYM